MPSLAGPIRSPLSGYYEQPCLQWTIAVPFLMDTRTHPRSGLLNPNTSTIYKLDDTLDNRDGFKIKEAQVVQSLKGYSFYPPFS